MRMRRAVWVGVLFLVIASLGLAASNAEMYFASDKNGQNRVTNVQEGNSVWIVIHDTDENIDCDVRDKIWTDVKIMDPKTGAYIVWKSYADLTGKGWSDPYDDEDYVPYKGHFPGNPGSLAEDYLEETGADTGLFVSSHAFQIGTRESFASGEPWKGTHVVDTPSSPPDEFKWGNYFYADLHNETKGGSNADGDWLHWVGAVTGNSAAFGSGYIDLPLSAYVLPSSLNGNRDTASPASWLVGRFENMDTLIGMYQDPNDDTDVATAMMKVIDTEATIAWDREIYKDGNEAATIIVTDADENLNCNEVEVVPVFILVNPGSWNPTNSADDPALTTGDSPNNFCMLKRTGGIAGNYTVAQDPALPPTTDYTNRPIRWFNIYNSEKNDYGTLGAKDGRYYIQYPKAGVFNPVYHGTLFDTASANGVTAVSFYAQETGPNTGVFQLNLNSLLVDLGFDSLDVRDVLVAYYLDPNDEDDFKLDAAYIEEKMHSIVSFTDATRQDKKLFWIGRDPVYVQVIDANANVDSCCPEQVVVHICDPHDEDDGEFWPLDETSSNSPVFFSNAGMELLPVWDALGVGVAGLMGGYQLVLDNWKLEAFNEDDIYVRYNDVDYVDGLQGMIGLGDSDTSTAYSGPRIDRVRVGNDVSFDLMSIGDTQVYNGQSVTMYFLDRQGNRVNGYVNLDCVFIEVVDPDQNEDILRRERIDGFWDGGQNLPFGPEAYNYWHCPEPDDTYGHFVNSLLGDTNIFDTTPATDDNDNAKIYVLNPRSGFWAALDLLETGVTTGDFVSVICVDLVNVYTCVPTLGALPGDTVVAFYQDPSNHSDSAIIQIKVAIGGGGTPPSQASTTAFVDVTGAAVTSYTDTDLVYVKVVDPSHAGASLLENAVTIDGQAFSLAHPAGWAENAFVTTGLDLNLAAGATITATYKDPTDPTDTSSDTILIVASKLDVTSFYAGPSPSAGAVTFGYNGTGIASVMSVEVYDLAGHLVWANELGNVTQIVWDGTASDCQPLANGAYIYLMTATDGTDTFSGKGTVFIRR